MTVLRHWADAMPRRDLIDEVETLRGRLRDAEFREGGLHEALRRETVTTQRAIEALGQIAAWDCDNFPEDAWRMVAAARQALGLPPTEGQ